MTSGSPDHGHLDGGQLNFGLSILELSEARRSPASRVYVAEGLEAPEWRAQWRS